jgi:hypothetical protein
MTNRYSIEPPWSRGWINNNRNEPCSLGRLESSHDFRSGYILQEHIRIPRTLLLYLSSKYIQSKVDIKLTVPGAGVDNLHGKART